MIDSIVNAISESFLIINEWKVYIENQVISGTF